MRTIPLRLMASLVAVPLCAAIALAVHAAETAAPAKTGTAQPAAAQPATAKAAPKQASTPTTAAVPPEVRARIAAKMPDAKITDVATTPIPGIYEVTLGGLVAYVTADGKYLISGSMYDVETKANLTEARRSVARAKVLAGAREDQMIVFSPPNPKMTVTVFTDIDCGFCRKFHSQIADVNKAGVRVRYMMFPRSGPDTDSWHKAEAVFCSADRKDALTRSKRGEALKVKDCKSTPVEKQYEMGDELGVNGTPAIFTQNGAYIGGFLTPDELVAAIRDSETPTPVAAAPASAR